MKKLSTKLLFFGFALLLAGNSYAQLAIPEGSQRAQVTQRVGTTDITIDYGRPKVNGRGEQKKQYWIALKKLMKMAEKLLRLLQMF